MKPTYILALVALACCAVTLSASASCSSATLRGGYGYQDVYEDSNGKAYVVGVMTFDGKANGTVSFLAHFPDGSISSSWGSDPLTITYTVAPDCTFNFAMDYNGQTFSGVIVDNAKELRYIESSGAQLRIGSAIAMKSRN